MLMLRTYLRLVCRAMRSQRKRRNDSNTISPLKWNGAQYPGKYKLHSISYRSCNRARIEDYAPCTNSHHMVGTPCCGSIQDENCCNGLHIRMILGLDEKQVEIARMPMPK